MAENYCYIGAASVIAPCLAYMAPCGVQSMTEDTTLVAQHIRDQQRRSSLNDSKSKKKNSVQWILLRRTDGYTECRILPYGLIKTLLMAEATCWTMSMPLRQARSSSFTSESCMSQLTPPSKHCAALRRASTLQMTLSILHLPAYLHPPTLCRSPPKEWPIQALVRGYLAASATHSGQRLFTDGRCGFDRGACHYLTGHLCMAACR